MIGFVQEYIDKKGIVVDFPQTLLQQIQAIIAYAEAMEKDYNDVIVQLSITVEALNKIKEQAKCDIGIADEALLELEENK